MNYASIVFYNPDLENKIKEYLRKPKQFVVWDWDFEESLRLAHVNDTVYLSTDNQLGCVLYKVKMDENNKKYLETIWTAEDDLNYAPTH
tara:strand:- start:862 stop:1128 length:267 start_codon:yes stop_codon:yes gene_type:complete